MKLFYKQYDGCRHHVYSILGVKIKLKLSSKELKKIQGERGNRFILHKENGTIEEFPDLNGLKVVFYGKNHTLELWEPINFKPTDYSQSLFQFWGNNNRVTIKKSNKLIKHLMISMQKENNELFIDEELGVETLFLESGDTSNNKITIGRDCLIAKNVNIMADDFHTVYDINNPENVLNKPEQGITIGNHVWITRDASILKGVTIPDNTIIANKSIVTKSFTKENTFIGGIPAKVIKENVNWDSKGVEDYLNEIKKD